MASMHENGKFDYDRIITLLLLAESKLLGYLKMSREGMDAIK